MKNEFQAFVVTLVALLCVGMSDADTLTGKVIGVKDGDTVIVLDSQKQSHDVRLAGIDAPEKAQAFGQRAKEHLSDTVFGKQVVIEGNKIDKYGRHVGKVLVNGTDANLEQVRAGFAWHYKEYEREQSSADRKLYSDAETSARAARLGLWRDNAPTPPWDWRHGSKTTDKQKVATQQSAECPCSGAELCTGARGGQFCIKPNGKRQYQ
ncbi:MAG: thermonuclease family protein [Betaproteobacteria bacterium]|nr:MAG: thermonuclease family protein [Betaproteobacteria bacterium]